MPFWEQGVKIPAVNYRGARKIGGAKTRGRSVQCGTDIPKMERKIGNTPGRLGRSRLQGLPSCHGRGVLVVSWARRPPAKENYLTHITENYYYVR